MQAELKPRRPNRRMQRMRRSARPRSRRCPAVSSVESSSTKHGFPVYPHKQPIEPVDQRADIVTFVERRNDNGELRPCLRWHSRGFDQYSEFSLLAEDRRRARGGGHSSPFDALAMADRVIRAGTVLWQKGAAMTRNGTHRSIAKFMSSAVAEQESVPRSPTWPSNKRCHKVCVKDEAFADALSQRQTLGPLDHRLLLSTRRVFTGACCSVRRRSYPSRSTFSTRTRSRIIRASSTGLPMSSSWPSTTATGSTVAGHLLCRGPRTSGSE